MRIPLFQLFLIFILGMNCATTRAAEAPAVDGNRFVHLHEASPYHVSHDFPRLTTPQWFGEQGVKAVVVFAIDDMRPNNVGDFEKFLRPLMDRLKKIDGKAGISIMTNQVNPDDPHLQRLIDEGINIDVHTWTHPCPCFDRGDFNTAKWTYEKCVDVMKSIPNNRAVAYRMPCLDIWNTNSPRFYTEIFNKTTEEGNFLTISSSTQLVFTDADKALPRDIVVDPNGRPRFTKYFNQGFVVFGRADYQYGNAIYNYPYPIVVDRLAWEIPLLVSDHTAQISHAAYGNSTLADWKTALDAAVLKEGIFSICFHPTYLLQPADHADYVDDALKKHGDAVRFLNFAEVQERIDKNLLLGQPLRNPENGQDNGVHLLDLNGDGFLDVLIGNEHKQLTRLWQPQSESWHETPLPVKLITIDKQGNRKDAGARFGIVGGDPVMILANDTQRGAWRFDGKAWRQDRALLEGLTLGDEAIDTVSAGVDNGVRLRDIDADGQCELLVANPGQHAIFAFDAASDSWKQTDRKLPAGVTIVDSQGRDAGLRFVDIDNDDRDDVMFSNDDRFALYLFDKTNDTWTEEIFDEKRDGDGVELPRIVREGTNNGSWFINGRMFVQNEYTGSLKDHAIILSFDEILHLKHLQGPSIKLTKWHVIGPFANENEKGFEKVFSPEETPGAIDLSFQDVGTDGKSVSWRAVDAKVEGNIAAFDLQAFCKKYGYRGNDLVVYLATTIHSPKEGKAILALGSEDGVKVWVNGQLVHKHFVRRPATPGADRVSIPLKKGSNLMLIKLEQISAGGAFIASVIGDEGLTHARYQEDN